MLRSLISLILTITLTIVIVSCSPTGPDPAPPASPSRLSAKAVSSSQIDVSWTDNSDNEKGFIIQRADGQNGTFSQISQATVNVTSYSDKNLDPSTTYIYRVRAYNDDGHSSFSAVASAETVAEPISPNAPSQLQADPVSDSEIILKWTDNSDNEIGFIVERSSGSSNSFSQITQVGADVAMYSDKDLIPSTTYTYRVKAFNDRGHSEYTDTNSATTDPKLNPPTRPTILDVQVVSSSQIDIKWIDNSSNEDGFIIERTEGLGGIFSQIGQVAADVRWYYDEGLRPSTTYTYRVKAFNEAGQSSYSDTRSATTASELLPPPPPSGLDVKVVSTSQINISWTDNSNTESGFVIERVEGSIGPFIQIAKVAADSSSYADLNLKPFTTYSYRVKAYNDAGESGYTDTKSATTDAELNPPMAPSELEAEAVSSTQVDIKWTDNAHSESGFIIERNEGFSGSFSQIAKVTADVESHSDKNLNPSTVYIYRVKAFNDVGNSGYTNPAAATTMPELEVPSSPSGLEVRAISTSQIEITWSDNSDNETGFIVERYDETSGSFVEVVKRNANITFFTDKYLTPSMTYTYRVKATNEDGDSEYTEEKSATTHTLLNPPATPSKLEARAVSSSQIDLTWNDNSDNEEEFIIERAIGLGGFFSELAHIQANVTLYSDKNLSPSTTYRYRLSARNDAGASSFAPLVEATTDAEDCMPNAPSNLTANVSGSGIVLNWTDNSDCETGFSIMRLVDDSGTFTELADISPDVTTYTDYDVSAGKCYEYKVYSRFPTTLSDFSNQAPACVGCGLTAPSDLVAIPLDQERIQLQWTDISDCETGVEVWGKKAIDSYWEGPFSFDGIDLDWVNVTDLEPGTTYEFKIRIRDSKGNYSSYSNVATATTDSDDPAIQSFPAAYDNLVMSSSGDPSIENTVYQKSYDGCGNHWIIGPVRSDLLASMTLFWFDVQSAISGKNIAKATLKLWVHSLPADQTTYAANALKGSWNPSSVTFSNCPGYYSEGEAVKKSPVTPSLPYEIDVTEIVRLWANGSIPNYGIVIRDTYWTPPGSPSFRATEFCSLEQYDGVLEHRPSLFIETY